jgi:hypothetical protein
VSDDDRRAALWQTVLRTLAACEVGAGEGDDELALAAADLRNLAAEKGARARVARIMRKEARVAEQMRATADPSTYARCALREGRLGAALTLAVAPPRSRGASAFRRFFYRLGGPANVLDKIVDLRADYAAGEIRLRPGVRAYGRLFLALARAAPNAVFAHPQSIRIVMLGVRWLVRLGKGTTTTALAEPLAQFTRVERRLGRP